ncbi:myo-inosose-2 dehydratase [Cohnella hongkongensis]|uniref:Myo-inosose-2 dehydratase n=1 Tax=Cohnella hongkongensis TaxID=178337 RepID=A0ABV9FBV9_9BACL
MSVAKAFKLGVGAIAWTNPGTPEFEDKYTAEEILSQMSAIGFDGTEMNRKFPTDPSDLQAALKRHRLEISSQFKFVLFSDRSCAAQEQEAFRKHADFLHGLNCSYVIVCEAGGSPFWDPRQPDSGVAVRLNEQGWQALTDNLHEAGAYCRRLGMRLLFHYHAATPVEQREEIDELMSRTDPELVSLLFDTGHALYGNYEPIELLCKYGSRIRYLHLKDVRLDVLARVRREGLNFRQAVVEGLFTVPGDGGIDYEPILRYLLETGFDSWALIEAEQNPATADPYEYSAKGKRHIEQWIEKLKQVES